MENKTPIETSSISANTKHYMALWASMDGGADYSDKNISGLFAQKIF